MAETKDDSQLPDEAELLCILKDSVQDVFEAMVITYSEAIDQDPAPVQDTEARIDFDGPIRGAVLLRCSHDGAESIARSLLMMEPGEVVAPEDVADSLGECANLITGRVKTVGLDPHGAFTMGTPQVRIQQRCARVSCRGVLVYRLETGALAAEIWLVEEGESLAA